MDFEPIVLGFDGREKELSKIERYIHNITPVMFYRTNNLIHSKRVRFHLENSSKEISSVYGDSFDFDYARTLAEVHDDGEIITGDFQLHDKENMDKKELETLEQEELKAIPEIINMYGNFANGFDYEYLLLDAKRKGSLEARFVSFFDKFDAAGEACHEVWAGNKYFIFPIGGKDGEEGGYIRRLNEFPKKYLNMGPFFSEFPGYLPKPFDFESATNNGELHTEKSLKKDSGFPLYERWKNTIIKNEGIENLIKQIEFGV